MRVFLTDLSISAEIVTGLAAALPEEQSRRAGNFAATVGFHLVRYAVKQIVPDADAAHWIYAEHGKPRLASGAPYFNLSHSRHGVAVAVSDEQEVGIDLEEIKMRPFKFMQRYYNKQESADVERASDKASEIVRIWTAKEAAAKQLGTGIDANFRNIPINRVQSSLLIVGDVPHWLSVTPADAPVQIEWIAAECLLPDI